MEPLLISGENLKVDDVVAVAHGRSVALDPVAIPRMERSRMAVDRLVTEGRAVYGITTGFGRFKDRLISPSEVRQLQLNLVRSHAVGVGPDLLVPVVRAMMLARANTLALGRRRGFRRVWRPMSNDGPTGVDQSSNRRRRTSTRLP